MTESIDKLKIAIDEAKVLDKSGRVSSTMGTGSNEGTVVLMVDGKRLILGGQDILDFDKVWKKTMSKLDELA